MKFCFISLIVSQKQILNRFPEESTHINHIKYTFCSVYPVKEGCLNSSNIASTHIKHK